MSAGDGWGEYVEEYESSLCVSLDIDHGYRWDTRYFRKFNSNANTSYLFVKENINLQNINLKKFSYFRYCQGVMVSGSVCQIEREYFQII